MPTTAESAVLEPADRVVPTLPMHDTVTPEFVEQYRRDGFAILRNALSAAEVQDLNDEALRLVRGDLGTIKGEAESALGATEAEMMRRYLCIHYPHRFPRRPCPH